MNTAVSATAMTTQPRASNRLLVIGFVLSTLFTTALTLTGGYFVQALAAQHSERRTEADQYQTLADAMDPLVTAFMNDYLAGRPTEKARILLQENIQKQYVSLEHAEQILAPGEASKSKLYRDQIVDVSGKLDTLSAPGESQALVQAISTARDTRVDVAASLQRAGDRWFSI